ncbi:MAG: Mu transposase C-terminal domain-containing protein [Gammaproteobacteria bacterium]|nr:Mu transposase C-terminal domain-containing protein [Gammaproteobacteria bacterium]
MKKLWFTASELAGLPGLPKNERNINLKGKRGEIVRQKKAKGKGWEYHLHSLPMPTQASLIKQHAPVSETTAITQSIPDLSYDKDGLWAHYERATQKKKDEARRKTGLLQQVMRLMDAGHTFKSAADAVAAANDVSAANLRNWYHGVNGKRGAKTYAKEDWLAAMVSGYAGRTATAECSEEAWDYYKADFLRNEQPTATACYERLQMAAVKHGWAIPSLSTLERRIKTIPLTTRVFLREGEHALMRLFPALERSVRDLHAIEWINGDGYQHNVFVKFPDGSIGRPKTWFWQDVYSRKFLAYRTDVSENTDTIRLSFGDVVEQYGIPEHATIDNTRAAANKWMTGGVPNRYRFKIKEDDPIGIFPMLDVKVHWTSVIAGHGHGQAKPIERAFGVGGIGEIVDKHPRLAGAFTGNSPMAKPENYGSSAIPLETFMEVLKEGVATFNARLKRKTEICAGVLSFDQAFEQSYSTALIRKATAEQRRLWMLAAESITIGRDGSFMLEAGGLVGRGRNRYGADALLEFIKHKVVVRFDPQQLHESVHVYTLDGRYIVEAECLQAAGYGDTQVGRAANRLRREKMKASKAAANAEQRLSILDAAALLPDTETPEPPETKLVRPVFGKAKRVVGSDIQTTEGDGNEELIESGDDFILSLWEQRKEEM